MKKNIKKLLEYAGLTLHRRNPNSFVEGWGEEKFEGLPTFQTIIDVGVGPCTPDLLRRYPGARHLLFEPISEFGSLIAKNYANVTHRLFPMGCGSTRSTYFD